MQNTILAMTKLTEIQLKSPLSELFLGTLTLEKLADGFILANYDDITMPDYMADIFWSAFSQLGGYYEEILHS